MNKHRDAEGNGTGVPAQSSGLRIHESKYLLGFLFLCSTCLVAEPIYLDCTLQSDSEQKKFSVALDESNARVTHTNQDGSSFNANGFYAANSIAYQNLEIIGSVKVQYRYEIDRRNLSATELFVAEPVDSSYAAKVPAKTTRMTGDCEVLDVRKRKI